MIHASESQHWYGRDGSPAYSVKSRDGTHRPATLRDARKMGLVPGVSTIIGCCAKPGLERWKLDQMMHAALTLPRIDGEAEERWIERVWADSKETAKKAAEKGTAIHAAIQGSYEREPLRPEMRPFVEAAEDAVDKWIGAIWSPELSFACPLGFGGKVDLSCPVAVLDFKTKEFGPTTDLKTWDEHAMQLAAYRQGLGSETARCAIVYVSVTQPGLAKLIEISEADLQSGWRMFLGLLQYWRAKTKYDASWLPEKVAA